MKPFLGERLWAYGVSFYKKIKPKSIIEKNILQVKLDSKRRSPITTSHPVLLQTETEFFTI